MALGLSLRAGDDARGRGRVTHLVALAFGLFGLAVAALAYVVLAGTNVQWTEIAGNELVGLSYIVAGTIAWLRRPDNRIGPAILVTGITSFIPVFVRVPIPAVTSAAFAFAWVTNVFAAFILLAYPSGRFFSGTARLIFWVAVLGTVIPVIARLFLLDTGSDFSSATGPSSLTYGCDCRNPFVLLPDDNLYGAAMLVSRLMTVLVTILILTLIVRRWYGASAARRRQLVPVLFAGAVGLVAFAIDEIAFTASNGEQPMLAVTSVGLVLARAAVPIGFLLGLLRTQIDMSLVGRFVVELGGAPSPERIEAMVAATLHDPSVQLGYWSPAAQAFMGAAGHRIEPIASATRAVAMVERNARSIATIVHDPALREDPGLVASVSAAVGLAIENQSLAAELQAQLDEVRASRARIVAAADAERARLERDIHDGAQQRLLALMIELRLAREAVGADPNVDLAARLDRAMTNLRSATDELRELARGVRPAILADAGLGPAVRTLAELSSCPVELSIHLAGRLDAAVESAAYFVVAESLANVVRHASATVARVEISIEPDPGRVVVAVTDDGVGGASVDRGSGIRGLKDRVEALGGQLAVESRAGNGTRIRVELPCAL
jgi:signal transduction histidine kinase